MLSSLSRRLVRYRVEGRRGGKPSIALAAADHPDPAAALEQLLAQRVNIVAPRPAKASETATARVLPAAVPLGIVMPFACVSEWEPMACSAIAVHHGMSFPELAIWDANGRRAGWHFGLPLPAHYWGAAYDGDASAA